MTPLFATPGKHHPVWKEWRRIARGKDDRFFLEHRQAVLESLSREHRPEQVLLSRELYDDDPVRWDEIASRNQGVSWFLIEGQALDEVASVPANSGLCAVFAPKCCELAHLLTQSFLLLVWELADPGNLGTLIRTVQALGGGGVIAIGGCRPWSAKVARSSAGTLLGANLLQLPVASAEQALSQMRASGFTMYGAFPHQGTSIEGIVWGRKSAVLLGNETKGLPNVMCDRVQAFSIPTTEVESLNVAAAGAIVCWEWRRSRIAG